MKTELKDDTQFISWVLSQKWEDCPEADLQEDIKRDIKYWKFTGATYNDLETRLIGMRACEEAKETLKSVYRKFRRRKNQVNGTAR